VRWAVGRLAVATLLLLPAACGGRDGLGPYRPPAVRRPPPPITDEVRLAVMGDWGSGTAAQAAVLRAMDRYAPEVGGFHGGLLLGDNFYPEGVDGPEDPAFVRLFERPFDTEWLGLLPWYPVLGNHDVIRSADAQVAYTARSRGRWQMPARHYRLDFRNAGDETLLTVLALDTNREYGQWRAQLAWLEEALDDLRAVPWPVVAMGHHPVRSYSTAFGRVEEQMDLLVGPLLRMRPAVDLYLAGHSHCMELIVVEGPALAVVGSGGKDLYGVEAGPGTLFHASAHGFAVLRASPGRLEIAFVDTDGAVLHRHAITR
jgi:hypothetical protein